MAVKRQVLKCVKFVVEKVIKVKIMIGAGQIDDQVRSFAGADAYGRDAIDAVKLAKGWIGG